MRKDCLIRLNATIAIFNNWYFKWCSGDGYVATSQKLASALRVALICSSSDHRLIDIILVLPFDSSYLLGSNSSVLLDFDADNGNKSPDICCLTSTLTKSAAALYRFYSLQIYWFRSSMCTSKSNRHVRMYVLLTRWVTIELVHDHDASYWAQRISASIPVTLASVFFLYILFSDIPKYFSG